LFYQKYKSYGPAKKAFIDTACANDWACARKIYFKTTGKAAKPDYSPAGNIIAKNK
jgi:hypothetical protein